MPITPVHFGINMSFYFLLSLVSSVEFIFLNCIFLLLAELIDVDHLFTKPIYKRRRSSFKSHFMHENWKSVSIGALLLLVLGILVDISFMVFVSFGVVSHLIVDFLHQKYVLKI